jgi:hypothetical protein
MPDITSPPIDPRCACHHTYTRHGTFEGRGPCGAIVNYRLCDCTGYVHCPSPDVLRALIASANDVWAVSAPEHVLALSAALDSVDAETAAVERRYAPKDAER